MLSKPRISATTVSRPGELPKPSGSVFYTLPLEDWLIAEADLCRGRGLGLPSTYTDWHPMPPKEKRPSYELLGEVILPYDAEPLIEKRDLAMLAFYSQEEWWRGLAYQDEVLARRPQVLFTWAGREDYAQYAVLDLAEGMKIVGKAGTNGVYDYALEAVLSAHPPRVRKSFATPDLPRGIPDGDPLVPLVLGWGGVEELLCQYCGGSLHWNAPAGPWSRGSAYCENSGHASRIGPPRPPCPTGVFTVLRTPLGISVRLGDFYPAPGVPPEKYPAGGKPRARKGGSGGIF